MLTAIILTIYHITRHGACLYFTQKEGEPGCAGREVVAVDLGKWIRCYTFRIFVQKASRHELRLMVGTHDVPPGFADPTYDDATLRTETKCTYCVNIYSGYKS